MFYVQPCSGVSRGGEAASEGCPVCCMSGFKDSNEMAAHIEEHFNQKGMHSKNIYSLMKHN